MDGGIQTFLLTQGVLGVCVLVLAGVVVKLYNDKEKTAREKFDLAIALMNDYKILSEKTVQAMSENSQNIRVLTEKIEVSKANQRDS